MQSTKLTKEERNSQIEDNHEESERIHNLVVKIISWRTGIIDRALVKTSDKITPAEWQKYKKHILTISKTEPKEVVKNRLDETYASIKKNRGFE